MPTANREWHSAAGGHPRAAAGYAVAGERGPLPLPLVAEALAEGGGLEKLARRTWPDGRAPSLRWVLCST